MEIEFSHTLWAPGGNAKMVFAAAAAAAAATKEETVCIGCATICFAILYSHLGARAAEGDNYRL
jgi:hypothetical protein